MTKLNPYEELGVPRNADRAAVRAGYRRRAKETHPDANGGSADAFKRTRTALSVLAVMGVIALFFTGRIPTRQPGSERKTGRAQARVESNPDCLPTTR